MKERSIHMQQTQEEELVDVVSTIGTTNAAKVILFNDDWHTFEEVINQLIKATNCSRQRAEELTLEVHNKGKACVYEGDLEDCLKVSSILEEIALHSQVEY